MRGLLSTALPHGHVDSAAVAARVRQLLSTTDAGEGIESSADRLGVGHDALRQSTDAEHPQPTLDVLIAVVREFGVDPMWLLTGVYDAATHRAVLDERSANVERVVTSLTTGEGSS